MKTLEHDKHIQSNKSKSIIELCINSNDDFYNHFSTINNGNILNDPNLKISDEVVNYLIEEVKSIPKKNSIIINFKLTNKVNCEIEVIKNILKNNISCRILSTNNLIKKINISSIFMIFIGILLIGITQFIHKTHSFNELIVVMSWVFMWKAIDFMFFEKSKLRRELFILKKIYFSSISETKV